MALLHLLFIIIIRGLIFKVTQKMIQKMNLTLFFLLLLLLHIICPLHNYIFKKDKYLIYVLLLLLPPPPPPLPLFIKNPSTSTLNKTSSISLTHMKNHPLTQIYT